MALSINCDEYFASHIIKVMKTKGVKMCAVKLFSSYNNVTVFYIKIFTLNWTELIKIL